MTDSFVMVKPELLERAASAVEKHHSSLSWPIAEELRAVLAQEAGPVVERQEPVSCSMGEGGHVAFLDIGSGGYVDLGTDQPLEALENLPYGRHMLGIIGTYGVDGWQPSVKQPVSEVEPVAYAAFADNGNIRIWSRSAGVVEMIANQAGKAVPLYTSPPAPVSVVLPTQKDFEQMVIARDGEIWVSVVGDHRDYNQDINQEYALFLACLDKVKELNQ